MPGEVEPRLIGLLQASIAFMDALRDLGLEKGVRVDLDREDGLRILELVAGGRHASAESWSQLGNPARQGLNSLNVAGVSFQWPTAETAVRAVSVLRSHALVSLLPDGANDNLGRKAVAHLGYGYED
jgi:hypothetical protein